MRVKGGMSLRNGMWHDLRNGIIILAEWHNYAECNFLKINYTKKARKFFKRSRIVKVKRTQPGPPNVFKPITRQDTAVNVVKSFTKISVVCSYVRT